jgi:DNA ligase (NAD+)
VRQLDSKICAERNVYWYTFNILEAIDIETGANVLSDSKSENFKWIDEIGFDIIPHMIASKTIKNDYDIEMMKSSAVKLGIPIDGMVLSFDSIKYSDSLGQTNHHPLHSIAFKFGDETEETILRSIEWNTTRSGQINPTACFDTVILDNTEVSRASLFNLTFIKDMQLNLLNRIQVSKRNMIIPYIEENLDRQDGNYMPIPEVCPSCGHKTEIRNTGTADFLFCPNDNCPAKLLDKFVHFCSRDAMNIDGFSEQTIQKFINKGWLKTFDDIYKLSEHKNEIINMEGFGQKSYTKLMTAIENSKTTKLENFIYALGIDQIGKGGSKRLAKHIQYDIQTLFDAIEDKYDFTNVEDFGEKTHDSIVEYFKNIDNCNTIVSLLNFIRFNDITLSVESNSPFSGKKVYCTGSFASHKKEELQNILESLGAEFASGYAKSLDYLIVGSLKGSGKVDKALKDGVPVMQEDEFLKIIGE